MKPSELLRMCADCLDQNPEQPIMWDLILAWPDKCGRFPFSGGGTEMLNRTNNGNGYAVPISRILTGLAKTLKQRRDEISQ